MPQDHYILRKTPDELKAMVTEKMDSGDYWIILPGLDGFYALKEIERRFYTGGADKDFEAIVTPINKTGVYGFVFALKRRLSALTLANFLRTPAIGLETRGKPISVVDLMHGSVVVLADAREADLLLKNFYLWIERERKTNGASSH